MRLPALPILIDEFPALRPRQWGGGTAAVGDVFVLSHFHTDHMKGLHASWSAGIILTSAITKQLLLSKYEGLRGRVFGLPFWCRAPVVCGAVGPSSVPAPPTSSGSTVYVTLLPAFHIPGSAMIYLETPSGVTYLHTGDFKYTEAARLSPLRAFLQSHRVDHVYLDDTWLHLGQAALTQWPSNGGGGLQVLCKLLNSTQVEEAMEAIRRRMEHQRRLFEQWQRDGDNRDGDVDAAQARRPFVVRVYLHNQFGKELLIQQLAECLRTRALLDDVRYARLLTVTEALAEERDDLRDFGVAEVGPPHRATCASPSEEPSACAALSEEEQAWRAAGGEAAHYPYRLPVFMSASQAAVLRSASEMPLVEVVSARSAIAPAALQAASEARGGTPHYGVVISGWARLQSGQPSGPAVGSGAQVWHIPTTLHSTPQEIVDLVALLRPLSVTPLHYRPSRGAVVMQRLGPYLRTPFVNRHDMGPHVPVPYWVLCLPHHVLAQCAPAPSAAGTSGGSGGGVDGLDALAVRPRLGYRVRPPRTEERADHVSSAALVGSTGADVSQEQCCSRRGSRTQGNGRKHGRGDEGNGYSSGDGASAPETPTVASTVALRCSALSLADIADGLVSTTESRGVDVGRTTTTTTLFPS